MPLRKHRFADARSVLRNPWLNDRSKTAEIHFLFAGRTSTMRRRTCRRHGGNRLALANDTLPADQHPPALLQGADILLRMEAFRLPGTVDAAPAGSASRSEAMLLRGQALLGEARLLKNKANDAAAKRRITEQYQAAVTLFRQAQDNQTPDSVTAGKAMYLVGVCLMEQGDLQGAADQFERTRLLHPSTPEALAAVLQEALVLRRTHQEDESLAAFRRVLRSVANPERYRNPWFSLEELRNRILERACRAGFGGPPVRRSACNRREQSGPFSTEQKTQTTAEIEQAWGRDLVKQTEHLPASRAEPVLREARRTPPPSRAVHARLAKMRIATPGNIPRIFWRNAANFVEASTAAAWLGRSSSTVSNEVRTAAARGRCWAWASRSWRSIESTTGSDVAEVIASYPQEDDRACRAGSWRPERY